MANSRSDLMANLLASPSVLNKVSLSGGRRRSKTATVVLDNTEAAGHLVPLARFDSGDYIEDVYICADTLAGATDVNVGVWTAVDWTLADGVVKDADIFVDGMTMNNAGASDSVWLRMSVAAAAGQRTPAQFGRQLWQDAGDTVAPPPGSQYDLVAQFVADPGAVATFKIKINYTARD